jgi:hypothetical protein
MTDDDFRRLALGMPGAIEKAHMGHPDFRANGRIFATLQADGRRGMVKVTPGEQRELMRSAPKSFTPASGAWGRQGCTMVQLDAIDEATVRGALLLAWEGTAAKPAKRRSSAVARPRRTK